MCVMSVVTYVTLIYTVRVTMRNDSVRLTRAGLVVYYAGLGLGGAVLLFGGVKLFALVVVATAQLLGI